MTNSTDTEAQARTEFIYKKYFAMENNLCDVIVLQKALSQIMYRDDLNELKFELIDTIDMLLGDLKKLYDMPINEQVQTAA